VPPAAHGTRQRGVCDLADQHVLERELDVARQLARRVATDEVARLEHGKCLVDVVDSGERSDAAAPECLPDDGGGEQRAACIRR
jgi:hypothetical protein